MDSLDNKDHKAAMNNPDWLVELEEEQMEVVTGGLLPAAWYQRWLNKFNAGNIDFYKAQRMVGRLLNEDAVGNTPTNNAVGYNWWQNLSYGDQFQWNVGVVQIINANVPPSANYYFRPFG
jgi:hypothetical protein